MRLRNRQGQVQQGPKRTGLGKTPKLGHQGITDVPWNPKEHGTRSEEHTSELQSRLHLVCRLLLEKKTAAFPELNAWERAGADASSAGMVDAGFENQKELTNMQLDNQKEIAEMQNETQKEIAGIQSATSRQNTKDQVYAQNEMLAYQHFYSTARVPPIIEISTLSKQQQ